MTFKSLSRDELTEYLTNGIPLPKSALTDDNTIDFYFEELLQFINIAENNYWAKSSDYLEITVTVDDEDFLILEHDARMIAPMPEVEYDGCMTLGKPSWGKPPEETDTGVLPIVQHTHGNHAILMSPHGAKRIMEYFENKETPTLDPADLFLGEARFDFIQKHVPYSFEVEDTFTLIQEGTSTKVKLDVDFDSYEELDPDENFHHSNNS